MIMAMWPTRVGHIAMITIRRLTGCAASAGKLLTIGHKFNKIGH
jgi:hypothetical protein